MDYETAVSISLAFTQAEYEPPEGFYFCWDDIAIVDANFDEIMHHKVDPVETYGEVYTQFVDSIKSLTPVIFDKKDTQKQSPFSYYSIDAGVFQIYPQGGGPILRVEIEDFYHHFEIHAVNLETADLDLNNNL